MPIAPDILRRLLVSRHLLASHEGRLTPQSDAMAVAQVILTAHDAAELAIAAVATAVGAEVKEHATLMDYPAPIAKAKGASADAFGGRGFLDQLNRVRRDFKHAGILPNVPQWYRVIENATDWISQWCAAYLDADFNSMQAGDLLTHEEVRRFYTAARTAHDAGDYRGALENLGRALLCVLEGVPRIWSPIVGKPNPHRALLLTAFGVSPSQLLTLEEFLPTVERDVFTREVSLSWETRQHGHPANWRRSHSRFCLEAFVDIALKVQHAEPLPMPIPFHMVYHDVIAAKDQVVELWHYEYGGRSLLASPTRGQTVATLQPRERLKCELFPSPQEVPLRPGAVPVTVENARVLEVRSETLPKGMAYVEREFVEVLFEEKGDLVALTILSEDK